jgi:precorrin-3B synthase
MELLAKLSAGEVRLTPFRLVLLPGVGATALGALGQADLIVDATDPRRAVVACPGAPACASASVDTRAAAVRLAPLLAGRNGVALHVSGCPKGCARPDTTALTLTGRDGFFDLVRDGRADSAPVRHRLDLTAAKRAVEDALVATKEP